MQAFDIHRLPATMAAAQCTANITCNTSHEFIKITGTTDFHSERLEIGLSITLNSIFTLFFRVLGI
jgi:hypothetical protein